MERSCVCDYIQGLTKQLRALDVSFTAADETSFYDALEAADCVLDCIFGESCTRIYAASAVRYGCSCIASCYQASRSRASRANLTHNHSRHS